MEDIEKNGPLWGPIGSPPPKGLVDISNWDDFSRKDMVD